MSKVAAAILLMLAAISALAWLSSSPVLPELAAGLPSGFVKASAEFEARVASRFPPGSSATEMVVELERQGFEVSGPSDVGANEVEIKPFGEPEGDGIWFVRNASSAGFGTSNFVCHNHWSIRWITDDDGRISKIAAMR